MDNIDLEKKVYEENKKFTYFAFFAGVAVGFIYSALLFFK